MEKKNDSWSSVTNTTGLLGVAFIVLKLCKVIDWSWWWVLAPFWGIIPVLIIVLIVVLIIKWFEK